MKTVSTKLDNKLHDKFLELCNDEGKCQSEFLRDLINEMCKPLDDRNQPPTQQDLDVESSLEPVVTITEI